MQKPLLRLYTAVVALLCAAPVFSSGPDLARTKEAGHGDKGRAALHRLYEIKAPERLHTPDDGRFRATAEESGPHERCATLPLIEIKRALGEMDAETLALARELLPADPAPSSLRKASALAGGAKLVTHMLPFRIETDNFSIEWGSELTNEDGTVPPTDANVNGVPDVVELWASYFEHAYTQIRALGYNDVPDLDTYKVTILIANSDPTTSEDNLGASFYGVTNGQVPHTAGTEPAYIIVSNNLGKIVQTSPNDESAKGFLEGIHGAMMVTAAHELHHVFQFLYAPNAWSNNATMSGINWYLEATSTWIEDEIYPFVNDYKQYFRTSTGWQLFPEVTLAINQNRTFAQSIKVSRTYGSSIFNKYLTEHVGGPLTVAEVWKGLKVGIPFADAVGDAGDVATSTNGAWTLDDVFIGFAAANATMDYDDGHLYGATPRRDNTDRPLPASPPLPEILGSTLVDNGNQSQTAKTLSLASLNPATRWGTAAVATVDDAAQSYALILPTKSATNTFVTPNGSNLTTLAAYFGPDLTTSSVALNLAAGVAADTTPPTQVGGLDLQRVPTGFEASWSAATDETKTAGYVIQHRPANQTKWAGRTILAPVRKASIRGLTPDADYEVRVFAFDSTGNIGLPSAQAPIKTGPAYAYPPVYPFNLSMPPQLNPIGAKAVVEGQTLTFTVSATDPDTPAANLVFGALQLPSGASFNQTTRTFSWTPGITQSGLYGVAFTVYDGSTTVWETVRITVTDANPSSSGSSGSGSAGGCFVNTLKR